MHYPGYLLNPGDMFQVEPERVLWATGARKDQDRYGPKAPEQHPVVSRQAQNKEEKGRKGSRSAKEGRKEDAGKAEDAKDAKDAKAKEPGEAVETAESGESGKTAEASELTEAGDNLAEGDTEVAAKPSRSVKDQLMELRDSVVKALEEEELTGKRKRELRSLRTEVTGAISKAARMSQDDVLLLRSQFSAIEAKLPSVQAAKEKGAFAAAYETELAAVADAKEQDRIRERMKEILDNPPDPTKPYLTPWRPRDYMSAFAFIPRYLEVNQRICSAVYLRHPVARPGLGEVPTPFDIQTSQLAFNWYLRRR
jgi:hypothetical protein